MACGQHDAHDFLDSNTICAKLAIKQVNRLVAQFHCLFAKGVGKYVIRWAPHPVI